MIMATSEQGGLHPNNADGKTSEIAKLFDEDFWVTR
jgi:hypothetical protein